MPSSDPLRRMSLAIGAGGAIALAAISPVFAGSTSGSSEATGACDAIVVQYPVIALMAEVECDEDVVVPGYTDNEDEQAEAAAEDQAAGDPSSDDQGDDQQGEDTSSAKPHSSHHSNDATETKDESQDSADSQDAEHDSADDDQGDSTEQSGGDESDGGSDSGDHSGSGDSNDD